MTGKSEQWLARLADPRGPNARWNPAPFDAAERLDALLGLAARHNVRPALTSNMLAILRADPRALVAEGDPETVEAVTLAANDARLLDLGRSVLLARAAERIASAVTAAGLPAVVVKGADFALNAYGGLQARTFSDVDILCRPDAQEELGSVLATLGYEAQQPKASRLDHTERSWLDRSGIGGPMLVEVHTDLVHAPELRAAQSLTYDHYASPAFGGITPAARLVLAAIHGSTSHLFGRLQYVVDGLMIARTGVESAEFAERAGRSGARLASAMLRLARDIFGSDEAASLLAALGPVPFAGLERRLITLRSVLGGKAADRWRLLPQRYLYRRLLRSSAVAPT